MKKLFFILLINLSLPVFAYFNYSQFQQFDNQVGIGFGLQQGNLSGQAPNTNANNTYQVTSFNLEIEKLFNIGIWLDTNINNVQTFSQSASHLGAAGAYPYLTGFNTKVGFSIPLNHVVALIPYLSWGINSNLSTYTEQRSIATNSPFTHAFFYTYGVGARAELLLNQYLELFFDQDIVYNSDQSNYSYPDSNNIINTSNYQTISMLGIKINLWHNLQLSSQTFYTTYSGYDNYSLNKMNIVNNQQGGLPLTGIGLFAAIGFTFQ